MRNNGSSGSGAAKSDDRSGSGNGSDVTTVDVAVAGATEDVSVQKLVTNMPGLTLMVDVDKAWQSLPEIPPIIDWCIGRNA